MPADETLLVREPANGALRPATRDEVLRAARASLARRLRRGASLESPRAAHDYLRMRMGALEHEVFGVLYLDLCGAVTYVRRRAG